MIRWFFQFALVVPLAVWVGSIVFFSAVITPGIFDVLERPEAGDLLTHLFPRYYFVGTACGLAALAAATLLFLFESGSRMLRAFQVVLVILMLAGNLYAGTILRGRITSLRQERVGMLTRTEREQVESRFRKLHRRSVVLNFAVLGLGVAGLGTLAVRGKRN